MKNKAYILHTTCSGKGFGNCLFILWLWAKSSDEDPELTATADT